MTKYKFDWKSSDSAPRNYPMQILAGNLIYPEGGSLYVPDKSSIHHGWGELGSSHIVGPDLKPLPNKLGISFFSYTENQFYGGRFDLPYDKIVQLFNEGYYSPNEGGHVTYSRILVGVAPGGAVAVWLIGLDKTTEVFFGHAAKEEGNWSSIYNNPNKTYTREEFVRLEIQDTLKTPEALEALRKNGVPIGLWDSYRTRYRWQPKFTGMEVRAGGVDSVDYFNGEKDYIAYPIKEPDTTTRVVPKQLRFIWAQTKVSGLKFKLYFDEAEIFAAFKTLGSHNELLQLDMRMDPIPADPKGTLRFSIWLRNDTDKIQLKKTNFETFGVQDLKN
jgi:hypothetical protein